MTTVGSKRADQPATAAAGSQPAPAGTTGRAGGVDEDKLMEFVFQIVGELGSTVNSALVVIGERLGYYRSLAAHGPSTATELAERTRTDTHYAREWLNAQAAGGYVTYEPATDRYLLEPERAAVLAAEDSPVYLQGGFQMAFGVVRDAAMLLEVARTGDGIPTAHHNDDVAEGTARFFGTTYAANLVQEWLPALDGVVEKLERGASVADVGCGHGVSTVLMAQAFPRSTFVGIDITSDSVAAARRRAADAGVADRVRFTEQPASELAGAGLDLVTFFTCLHDMGDPVGAARQARECIAEDGTLLVVEPAAADRVEDNLHPVGRLSYCMSTLLCVPESLSQEVGLALGAQAGPARIRDVLTTAGFTRFRTAAQTPFSHVYEARP